MRADFWKENQFSFQWDLDVLQRGFVERPLPCAGVAGHGNLVTLRDHRAAEFDDVLRESAGVGAEGEVEDTERRFGHDKVTR